MTNRKICILGLGYIGVPTATIFAMQQHDVLGVDVNPLVVETLRRGHLHIEEPGLATLARAAIRSGALRVALEPEPADVFIICVPTPLTGDHEVDLSAVESAGRAVVPHLRSGNLVILESTSPPGTTRDVLCPILAESGLEPGRQLRVAYCPERVLPGRTMKEMIVNDRVIGGIDAASSAAGRELYRTVVEGKILETDATTAEMCKVAENTFRDVNIALANELASMCGRLGIDAWEVVRLANHHPRVDIHKPGPGVGGHCISVDPWFLVEKFPDLARLVRTAREVNDAQPRRVVAGVERWLGGRDRMRDLKVTVMGVTYKANVDDCRETPSLEVVRGLEELGCALAVHDPHVKSFEVPLTGLEESVQGSDCLVMLVDHDVFRYLSPRTLGKQMRTRRVYDARNCLDRDEWTGAGFEVKLLGG